MANGYHAVKVKAEDIPKTAFSIHKGHWEWVIKHPDNLKPLILHTDASYGGIAGTLSQIDDNGIEHPCAFISRAFNPAEKNYSVTEKELLAAVWSMKKFKYFLYGQKLDLNTDHQALRVIFQNKSDDVLSRIVRFISKTTDYFPNIIYEKGKDNAVADALSRAYYTTNLDSNELLNDQILDELSHDDFKRNNCQRKLTRTN